ncbi:MAG: transglycosylase SLT domain-containing protein [Pseudomonadota bacterium]|jgi:membrane-bound lytic murein transglycosylase D
MRRTTSPFAGLAACLVLFLIAPVAAGTAPSSPAAQPEQAALPTIDIRDPLPAIATIDLTIPPDDLWQRVRHGFSMPNLDSELVLDWQAWYLSRPEYLKRIIERSRRYLYHIVEQLERRGMPTELALLPMVESAYNPMAYSPARASGIWQFIPSTGKNFNLEQNWWVDERRDIIASTSAALDYLQQIYEMHGDWHLALASYNWGEGAVARAIAKNQAKGAPTDYLSLTMPAETRNYVPKLQALKNIIAQPDLFKVNLEAIPNQPYFVTVDKPADMDLAVAAKLAEMSTEEFIALNPAYKRPVMPAKDKTSIILPVDKADIFRANLEEYDAPLVSWQAYTLRKGDRLDKVASRFGISLARLKQVNGISGRTRIGPGNTLLVPSRGNAATTDLTRVNVPAVQPEVKTVNRGKKAGKSVRAAKGSRPAKQVAAKASPRRAAARGTVRNPAAAKPKSKAVASKRPDSRS